MMNSEQLEEASAKLLEAREEVDSYLKKYKGLLDFQVRLTNVYDRNYLAASEIGYAA